ncbi:hypothetical protein CsSME_00048957 [Camellia sinensis var. sinensis]
MGRKVFWVFTKGTDPDIVINSHAFPSRQTPGQLLETALGKGIACGGSLRYATPFSTISIDAIMDLLHRQPMAGRKRFGGIKFGEMERDCLIAHGAAANLHERLFMLSDSFQMHICRKCKNIANVIQRPVPGHISEDIVRVNVPYGAKLLCQELFSMGIFLKFDNEVF